MPFIIVLNLMNSPILLKIISAASKGHVTLSY
jgi:hypothetical protein